MVLGAIACEKNQKVKIYKDLRRLKQKHGLPDSFECKWTKIGPAKLEYYLDVVNFFFENPYLSFRGIIADKSQLRHQDFNQTHNEWYYKMYYLLLKQKLNPPESYKIYIDIKDTVGGSKIRKLEEILKHILFSFYDETVLGLQQINSKESELLQMVDVIIGAISYENRNIKTSNAKLTVINRIMEKSGSNLKYSTSLFEEKFNIFVWNPSHKGGF
jgi:hypothetical protein